MLEIQSKTRLNKSLVDYFVKREKPGNIICNLSEIPQHFFETSPIFDRFAMVHNILATLRRARIFQSISQQNIADFLEITQSSYAKIERGQSKLSVDVMLKLCQYLSISPSFLFDQEQHKPLPPKERIEGNVAEDINGMLREIDRRNSNPKNFGGTGN